MKSWIRHCTLLFQMENYFPLNNLILSDCGFNSDDFRSFAQCNCQGRIPELKHLDVSMNPECGGKYVSYLVFRKQLFQRYSEIIISQVRACCLKRLQELSLTVYTCSYFSDSSLVLWREGLNTFVSMSIPLLRSMFLWQIMLIIQCPNHRTTWFVRIYFGLFAMFLLSHRQCTFASWEYLLTSIYFFSKHICLFTS